MSPTAAVMDARCDGAVAVPLAREAPRESASVEAAPRVLVQCETAEQEQRLLEELDEADAVLSDDVWRWFSDLAGAMHCDAIKNRTKVFFLRLLRASTRDAVELVLSDMETWRDALRGTNAKATQLDRDERKGVQALFLLGLDKQMSLNRRS